MIQPNPREFFAHQINCEYDHDNINCEFILGIEEKKVRRMDIVGISVGGVMIAGPAPSLTMYVTSKERIAGKRIRCTVEPLEAHKKLACSITSK